jgi:hypothetical protein
MEEAANRLKVAHEMPALTREVFDAEWRETRAPLLDRRDDLTASVDKALEKYLKTLVELSEHTQIISTRAGEYADLASQHFTEPPIGWYRLFGFTGDIAQHPRELYAQRANKIDEFMRTNAKK